MLNLTLLILAYNRPFQLSRLLGSVQSSLDKISNKPCNIDIILAYNEPLPVSGSFIPTSLSRHACLSSFRIISRPYNIQLDTHLSLCYNLCKTGYVWPISDDDILFEFSLPQIISLIENVCSRPHTQSFPPIYLNWTSFDAPPLTPPAPGITYNKLTLEEFSRLDRSTFFLSAIIAHKSDSSLCLRVFDGFTHYGFLLSQVIASESILVCQDPVIGFDPQCSYTDRWLYLFLIALPIFFDHYCTVGLSPSSARNIFSTSLANKTGYSTIFHLASKQSFSSKIYYLSSIYHWSKYHPLSLKIVAPFLFLLSPFFSPLKLILHFFK